MELPLCFLLGVLLGVLAGLLPGVHVNNLTPWVLLLVTSLGLSPLSGAAALVSMAVVQTFTSYIPSTFLGVPDEGTALSILPTHRMVLEGRGYLAVRLTTWGCLSSLLLGSLLALPLALTFGRVYSLLRPAMGWILLSVVILMVVSEGSPRRMAWALLVFLLSGLLGLLTLDGGGEVLMPLLSGLFGMSVLLESLATRGRLPEQRGEGEDPSLPLSPLLSGVGAGIFTGFLPGIGPAEGTVLSQLATRSRDTKDFLLSVSAVNMVKVLFSFVALYAIGRPRSGAAVAVGELLEVGRGELLFLLGMALLAGALSSLLTPALGRLFCSVLPRIPYRALGAFTLLLILSLTILLCGPSGLPLLLTATAIGLIPARVGVRRSHAMGVILLPCTLYFLGLRSL